MNKVCRFFLKLVGILVLVFGVLFAIFFFDLDGKLLFNVVEPFLKNHYDNKGHKVGYTHDTLLGKKTKVK